MHLLFFSLVVWAAYVAAVLQIGQVMLALPNALANTGIRAGVPLLFVYSLFSMFTIHLLTALYAEYKARKVQSPRLLT